MIDDSEVGHGAHAGSLATGRDPAASRYLAAPEGSDLTVNSLLRPGCDLRVVPLDNHPRSMYVAFRSPPATPASRRRCQCRCDDAAGISPLLRRRPSARAGRDGKRQQLTRGKRIRGEEKGPVTKIRPVPFPRLRISVFVDVVWLKFRNTRAFF